MSDLDLLLTLSLIATFHNHPGIIREKVKRLMPTVHPTRRGSLALIIASKDPVNLIRKLCIDW